MFTAHVPYFLPQIPHRLRVRNRVMTSYHPLFTSYVFLLANQEERVTALATARVVQTLTVGDQDRLWRDLTQVHRLLESGAPIHAEDRLVAGARVEIKSGPLAGLCGTIVQEASKRRFIVAVDFIQRGASVLLDDIHLSALGD
jgi:transcriptional antiterminator RfaH